MLPRVQEEFEELKNIYEQAELHQNPDGSIHIEIPDVRIQDWWEPTTIRTLLVIQPDYPQSRPMIFVQDDLKLKGSGIKPKGSGGPSQLRGKNWLSLCWNPENWDISNQTLLRAFRFGLLRFELKE